MRGEKKKEVGKGERKKKRKKKELSTLNHSIRAYPKILSIELHAYNSFLVTL